MTFRFVRLRAVLQRFEGGSSAASGSFEASGGRSAFVRVLLRVTGELGGAEHLAEGSVDVEEVSD